MSRFEVSSLYYVFVYRLVIVEVHKRIVGWVVDLSVAHGIDQVLSFVFGDRGSASLIGGRRYARWDRWRSRVWV